MKSKKLIISYLILLHLFLAFVIVKTDFISRAKQKIGLPAVELSEYYHDTVDTHTTIDAHLPKGTTLFIGDSITQGIAVSAITSPSVNFGIGFDTTYGVIQRIPKYTSLKTAKAVVLAIGYNDLHRRGNEEIIKNYQQILTLIPKQTPVIINAILPLDERLEKVTGNTRIRQINSKLKEMSQQNENVNFLDTSNKLVDSTGNLAKEYHVGDGIHLNPHGYKVWIDLLKKELVD